MAILPGLILALLLAFGGQYLSQLIGIDMMGMPKSPISAIKVDNSIVHDIVGSERDQAAFSAAVAIADKLGIGVVAEGVETDEQARIVGEHGCRYMQGFLFSLPMAETEIIKYLDDAERRAIDRARRW